MPPKRDRVGEVADQVVVGGVLAHCHRHTDGDIAYMLRIGYSGHQYVERRRDHGKWCDTVTSAKFADLRREVAAFGAESIQVVYGVYDLTTLFVTAAPTTHPTDPGFAQAPRQDELTELATRLVKAVVDKGILGNRLDLLSKIV